jgi:hypothetical protein
MNTAILKSPTNWVAFVATVLGVLLSQQVVGDGVISAGMGWAMLLAGPFALGHQVAIGKILV